MKVTKVLNRWLNRLYKVLAILLVLIAVVVSAIRLILPHVDDYRPRLQSYLSDHYQVDVVIGQISAQWQVLNFGIVAKNVTLLQSKQASVVIDKIDINIDFWQSIKALALVTDDFTLSGMQVFIDQQALNNTTNKTNNNQQTLTKITNLFLSQITRFAVKDSQVVIKTAKNSLHPLQIKHVNWQNNNYHHQAQGGIVFGNLSAESVNLQLDLIGEKQADLTGQIYIDGNNVDITSWLGKQINLTENNISSAVNFKSWLTLAQGEISQLQLVLENSQLHWQDQNNDHLLALKQGQINIEYSAATETFTLLSSPFEFELDQQPWQPITAQMSWNSELQSAYISIIELEKITALIPLLNKQDKLSRYIDESSPKGEINDFYWQNSNHRTQMVANFTDVSVSFSQGIPGVQHLYGDLQADANIFRLTLKAKQGEIDFDKHFIRPMPYQYLSVILDGYVEGDSWHIGSDDLIFNSDELSLRGSVGLSAMQGKSPELSLFAQVNNVAAQNAKYYFPHLLMGKSLVGYLNRGILSGTIPQAKVLFNGALSQFPFNENNGIFVVDAELIDSQFSFDPEWPRIEHFYANLNFTNNSMFITGRSGELSGIDVSGVTANIADLSGEQLLVITHQFNDVAPEKISALMAHSPLKSTVGLTLEKVRIQQNIAGEFTLKLPLKKPENVEAAGTVYFADNKISLATPQMLFEQVNGTLHFKNDNISLDDLSLSWLNMPLKLAITGSAKELFYQTDIDIKAHWQDKSWSKNLPIQLKKYLAGDFYWQGKLSLYIPENGNFAYHLAANSTTEALAFKLPQPYQKKLNEKWPFKLSVDGELNQSHLAISLGDKLSFTGELEHDNAHFSRAHLVLGKEHMMLPTDGFHITAQLAQASVAQWQPLINDIITMVESYATANNQQQSLLAAPQRIRGDIDQLLVYDHKFNHVSFNLFNQTQWWLLQLNSQEARGEVKLFPDLFQQGIEINADFIHLSNVTNKDQSTNLLVKDSQRIFNNIPPMKVHCDSCTLDIIDFGSIDFNLVRKQADLISIENFIAKRDKTELRLTGLWQQNDHQSKTSLIGRFKTAKIEQEFKKLGYASTIKESGGYIEFSLFWEDSPFNFSFAKLNGDLKAKIEDGYLAEVSDKGARIFSVLSLDSLVRKLTLDFRDIFSDGMFYSYIRGDFHIQNGVVYTKNTKMKGAAGDLYMKGNTNLATGTLDYHMSYKPNLTSSLPVLAWVSTLDPVTFLAGIALDKVLTSTVVSEFQFELTGTVTEPNLKEVTRKTRDVAVGRSVPPKFIDNNQSDEISEKQQVDKTDG
jgi:uncharacterized protein (TIGR02099 family)